MRPSVGVIEYKKCMGDKYYNAYVGNLDLTKHATASEGKIIHESDSMVLVMIPVYLKGDDKKKWLKGFAVENADGWTSCTVVER